MKKILTFSIMLMFVGISISSSTGSIIYPNKTKPLGVTISFYPSEPNGDNGWYVTYVEVNFHTDNGTIIKKIEFRFDGGSWIEFLSDKIYWEENITYHFLVIDTEENYWYFGPYNIKIDVTPPDIEEVEMKAYKESGFWYVDIKCNATDPPNIWDGPCSGMDRVEMFIRGGLEETIKGDGPIYIFEWLYQLISRHMLYFHYYDKAGNSITNCINGSNVTAYPDSQNYNMFFSRWLDRFPLLHQFIIRIMERWNL
jgi:hypothetical protein